MLEHILDLNRLIGIFHKISCCTIFEPLIAQLDIEFLRLLKELIKDVILIIAFWSLEGLVSGLAPSTLLYVDLFALTSVDNDSELLGFDAMVYNPLQFFQLLRLVLLCTNIIDELDVLV